ncbi:DUF4398 domain-containing protein [Calditrichota bacterium]
MRKTTLTFTILFSLILSISIMGCSSPPDAEMEGAEAEITKAIQAGADEFSPKLLDRARRYYSEAKIAYDAGDFKEAMNKAELTRMTAEKAIKNSDRMSGHVPGQVSDDEE